jgi:hypothetical protein
MFILNVVKVAEAIVGFINPFEMEQKRKRNKQMKCKGASAFF